MSESDFHHTLRELREVRDTVERDFAARLEALDERVAAAREALETAAEAASRSAGRARPGGRQSEEERSRDDSTGHGTVYVSPGLVGRLLDRLQGGRLARIERQQRQLGARIEAANVASLVGEAREHVEAVRELAGRVAEALETSALAIRRGLDLLNAKEAETVHVATHGARAQAELTMSELARQQEALLAELVGRRQDLERLVEAARAAGGGAQGTSGQDES